MIQILLVEDNSSVRAYIVRALELAGYGVTIAADVQDGLDQLSTTRFDLMLTNIVTIAAGEAGLPDRAWSLQPELRIIFLRGFAAVVMHDSNHGEAAVASPPFHLRALISQLDHMFMIDRAADL